MQDKNQIVKVVFDATRLLLNVAVVGNSTTQGTQLDEAQIWQKIFDPATNTIRVAPV